MIAVSSKTSSTGAHTPKRLAKLAISLLYFCAQAACRLVVRTAGHLPRPRLVVLCYHGLPDRYLSNFVRQMEALSHATRVVPASYRGDLPSDRTNVAITFDDAYVSVAKNALPELAARRFHSTIFVPTGVLGSRPTWSMDDGSLDAQETVMAADQIAALPSPLVAVGSHTITHPRLSNIDHDDARREIEDSRRALQELTTQDVRLLAFPHGDHNAAILALCRDAGYEQVFSINPHSVDTTSSDFVRGRVRVEPFDGRLEFLLKYNGAYAWASYVTSLRRTLNRSGKFRSRAALLNTYE
jgi:peptidoglycan/xylan/chitin deacetylase (PgdA/CDA1 family)